MIIMDVKRAHGTGNYKQKSTERAAEFVLGTPRILSDETLGHS